MKRLLILFLVLGALQGLAQRQIPARQLDLSGVGGASLPSQTGNAGKVLTTDGSTASWTYGLPTFDVRSYGANLSDATTDRAAFQAAVAAATAAGGGTILIPNGTLTTDSTLYFTSRDIKIVGVGKAVIQSTFATGDILFAEPATTPVNDGTQNQGLQGVEIRNLDFQTTVTRTSGAAIHLKYSEHAIVNNVRIGTMPQGDGTALSLNKHYDGIFMEYAAAMNLSQVQIYPHHTGIKVSGNTAAAFWAYFNYDGFIHGNWQIWGDRSAGSTGIHIGGGIGGLRVMQGNVVWTETGVQVDKTLHSVTNRELFFNDCFVDSQDGHGYNFAASSVGILAMSNIWVAGIGRGTTGMTGYPYGAAINVAAQGTGFRAMISGGYIYQVYGAGLVAQNGEWTISGLSINEVGLGTNGGDGIDLGSGCENVSISGCTLLRNGVAARGYGLRLSTAIANFNVTGNTFSGNAQGAYSGAADDGLAKKVRSNSGVAEPASSSTVYPSDEFTASDITDIEGRATPVGGQIWQRTHAPFPVDDGTIGIVSGAIKQTSSTSTYSIYYLACPTRNIDYRATLSAVGGNAYFKLAHSNDNNNIQVDLTTGETKQILGGTITTVVAASGTTVAGDIMRAVLNGTSISIYRNGTLLGTGTVDNSTLTSVNHGIMIYHETGTAITAVQTSAPL